MPTPWEPIETRAMTYIQNDTSLDYDLKYRPAVFFNRMERYMEGAIPKFNRPPEMLGRLASYKLPKFEALNYVQETEPEEDVIIETELTDYGICSAGIIGTDEIGNPTYTPLNAVYDQETGTVTIPMDAIRKDDVADIYLYKSGEFRANLSNTEQDILAFGIVMMWEHRFDNDAIERKSKIRDNSFTTISEASQTNANSSRMKQVDEQFYGMLRAYQDNLEYSRVVMGRGYFPAADTQNLAFTDENGNVVISEV